MKTVEIKINLYELKELEEKAQRKAIEEHRNFLLSIMQPEDFISGEAEHDTPEELQKQYDSEYVYYELEDEPIIELIEANEYLYYANGKMANCTTYTGNHPKSGTTELKIFNQVFVI